MMPVWAFMLVLVYVKGVEYEVRQAADRGTVWTSICIVGLFVFSLVAYFREWVW